MVDESGEGIVGAGISGLGRRSNVEGSIEWDVGEKCFCGVEAFLCFAEVSFTGCQRFWEKLGD